MHGTLPPKHLEFGSGKIAAAAEECSYGLSRNGAASNMASLEKS
jgi:hypothetical protein